jgi:PelA/Pel-15E family pectate lyase
MATWTALIGLLMLGWAMSPAAGATRPPGQTSITWARLLDQPPAFYATAEAIRVADNLLLYQRAKGGWPKNIEMTAAVDRSARRRIASEKTQADSTIDNGATTTELRYLATVFEATTRARFRTAFLDGLAYLLRAQYANGGWPQFHPLRTDYSRHITFNDDAMINVMTLLRDVGARRAPFRFVDETRRARARQAVERGVAVILASQIRVGGPSTSSGSPRAESRGGRLTAWCAQHHEATLAPAGARTYEHPSLSGRETVQIVRFLMSIDGPSPEVIASIEAAIAWLREARLTGWRLEERRATGTDRDFDVALVRDGAAPPLWARFYEIGTNRPIFSGRDGIVRYELSDIEYERRANYRWAGTWPAELLDNEYPAWRATRREAQTPKGRGARRSVRDRPLTVTFSSTRPSTACTTSGLATLSKRQPMIRTSSIGSCG